MADKRLQIKRRIVDGSAPQVGDLLEGEIAVNLITGTVYFGGPNGESIITISGGAGGSPGGSSTQIQYNDGGSFAGIPELTFNKTTHNLSYNQQGNNDFISINVHASASNSKILSFFDKSANIAWWIDEEGIIEFNSLRECTINSIGFTIGDIDVNETGLVMRLSSADGEITINDGSGSTMEYLSINRNASSRNSILEVNDTTGKVLRLVRNGYTAPETYCDVIIESDSSFNVLPSNTNGTIQVNGVDVVLTNDSRLTSVHAFSTDVNFGSSFTNYKQHIVTGLSWITSNSKIVITPYTASNNADEIAVVNFSFVVSDIVPGTGFTLTIYTEVEVKGTYTFNCLGV